LLLPNTSFANSSTDFCVKFYGVSSFNVSSSDIPLSRIYKPKSISNPCPSTNLGLLYDNTMASGLKSCTIGPSTSIYCSWKECDYCCSICGCGSCFSIGISSWTTI
jgi:hypothetical protein